MDEQEEADDLEALANAVREATTPRTPAEPTGQGIEVGPPRAPAVLRPPRTVRQARLARPVLPTGPRQGIPDTVRKVQERLR